MFYHNLLFKSFLNAVPGLFLSFKLRKAVSGKNEKERKRPSPFPISTNSPVLRPDILSPFSGPCLYSQLSLIYLSKQVHLQSALSVGYRQADINKAFRFIRLAA